MSGDRVFRALTRATLMVIAPSAPVAWSPGTPPLTETLRARVIAGAASAAERAIEVLPVSGRRVVVVPVETAVRRVIAERSRSSDRRVALPVGAPSTGTLMAPWGVPEPVPGVVVRTNAVPVTWLRRPPAGPPSVVTAAVAVPAPRSAPRPAPAQRPETEQRPEPAPRPEPRPVPTSMRIRKAAVMAVGLLVSLVAVEAAARVGRR